MEHNMMTDDDVAASNLVNDHFKDRKKRKDKQQKSS